MKLARLAAAHGAFILVALSAAALYLALAWTENIGVQDDGVIYLFSARHFAFWLPTDPVAAAYANDSPFPPLYPLLLALLGAAQDPLAAHAITVSTFVLALAALYAWLLALGIGRATAAAAAAIVAVCPGTVWLMFNLLSEPLYVALSLGACALFASTRDRRQPRPDAATLGATALVTAAILTRSVGITLLPALALYLWQRHRLRALPLLVAAVLPQALWSLTHHSSLGYSGILRDVIPQLLHELGPFLQAQLAVLTTGLRENLFMASLWYVIPFAAGGLAAATVRALRGQPDAIALFGYFGLLLLWPFPAEAQRFTWVAVPLLIGNLLWGVRMLAERWRDAAPDLAPRLPALCALALAIAVAPSPALVATRWFSPEAAERPELRHVGIWYSPVLADAYTYAPMEYALAQALRDFGARMPPGECSLSILSRLVAYYGWHYSLLPPPPYRYGAEFDASLRWRKCQYLVMVNATTASGPVPFYPRDRLAADRYDVIERRTVMVNGAEAPLAILAKLKPEPQP